MSMIWVIRCVILALGAAFAVALIARGNVVIGGFVGALVVCRAALFLAMTSRRRELRRRVQARRQARPDPARWSQNVR
jgi:hypothetical protein